ncbi:helix-turn-helix domain-containing protein [Azohydromonas aeria]|uniref:helix-turn-helix domain-containing protein n=1 Tax=Azohydromonas aeria TaxID=2590212 RepID=UPI0012FBED04|nr:helix-turn-helix domain-containing protein [Azohydromonas aeria]
MPNSETNCQQPSAWQHFDTIAALALWPRGELALMSRTKNRPSDLSESPAPRCVRALLDAKGIPRRQHAAVAAEALSLSIRATERKLNGKAAWTVEEIARVGEHVDVPLLLGMGPLLEREGERALLYVGAMYLRCLAVLGETVEPPFRDDMVAVSVPGQWLIVPSKDLKLPAKRVLQVFVTDFVGVAGLSPNAAG